MGPRNPITVPALKDLHPDAQKVIIRVLRDVQRRIRQESQRQSTA
jgi:hypothetical protein